MVFTALRENKKLVLKIYQAVDEEHVKSILEYAHYLGNCGIYISSPIENQNGNIYEVAKDGDTLLIATEISVIDFDCAECHFFVNDILLPVQGLLFDVTGGMMTPISKPEVLKEFYRHFMEGYRTENELDEFWIGQLGVFLEYRRLLLYTVLQGWLSNDKKADEAFLNMINHPCDLSILESVN